jgi:hypothetical protein
VKPQAQHKPRAQQRPKQKLGRHHKQKQPRDAQGHGG